MLQVVLIIENLGKAWVSHSLFVRDKVCIMKKNIKSCDDFIISAVVLIMKIK